jgi:hypothetical protein
LTNLKGLPGRGVLAENLTSSELAHRAAEPRVQLDLPIAAIAVNE